MPLQFLTGLNLHKRVVVLLFLSLCLNYSSAQRNVDPELQSKIDDFIQHTYLPAAGISTLGLSVVQNNGELLYTTGYGLANQEKNIQATNSTQFLVASITKSFTSVVAIKLLHEKFPDLGEGVMDTPIRQLLPDINFTLNDRYKSEQTTFRDLLAHRLCSRIQAVQIFADPIMNTEEMFYRARYATPDCGFRSNFEYNNQFYTVAGELLGILAGKSYEELLQDFLDELGMSNSVLAHHSDNFDQIPNRSLPYYRLNDQFHLYNYNLSKRIVSSNPGAGLFSTPDDMAKYNQFIQNRGSLDGRQIIPEDVMKWLITPSQATNHFPGIVYKENNTSDQVVSTFSYGLGFFLAAYDSWQLVQHQGNVPPYISLLSFFPAKKLGIFTTTNMAPLNVDQMVIHVFIFETLKGSADAAEKAMKVKSQLERKMAGDGSAAEKKLSEFLYDPEYHGKGGKVAVDIVGEYGHGNLGEAVVSEKFNKRTNRVELYLEYGRWYKGWLEHVSGTIHEIHWSTDVFQDDYVLGGKLWTYYAALTSDGNLVLYNAIFGATLFYRRVSLESLPPTPWSLDSCGPT